MKKIVLTGGGTAGHVTPNLSLINILKENGFEPYYIGSKNGMERELVKRRDIPYYGVSTGKLRRYHSIENFKDPFRIVKGYFEAKRLLKEINPSIIFSKGGFVSFPVVRAAKSLKIPVILHESDLSIGLANKLSLSSATKVCVCFKETLQSLGENKAVLTGTPIREELFKGDRNEGIKFCGFEDNKPVILVMGGSLGAMNLNKAIDNILDRLLEKFNIVHLCGKDKINKDRLDKTGYKQIEYVNEELPHLFAMSDIAVSRAGANAISELLALHIPSLLIPLSKNSSRGDQILNARSYTKSGFSLMMEEEDITDDGLYDEIIKLYNDKEKFISTMRDTIAAEPKEIILDLIKEIAL